MSLESANHDLRNTRRAESICQSLRTARTECSFLDVVEIGWKNVADLACGSAESFRILLSYKDRTLENLKSLDHDGRAFRKSFKIRNHIAESFLNIDDEQSRL